MASDGILRADCQSAQTCGLTTTQNRYNRLRELILAGAGRGLQTRRAVLSIAGGFDSH